MPNNSTVPEEVLPCVIGENWEEWVESLLKMEPQVLEREEPKILKKYNFPNTYTLTKNLAEQALKKYRHPRLCLTVSRPAVVTATQKYPFKGWTDSIAAGGAVVYSYGMGISGRDLAYPGVINATIPCDYVVNTILVATAHVASLPTPSFKLYHGSPSGISDIKQTEFFKECFEYLKY